MIRLFIVTWIIWVKRFVKYLNKRSWSLTMQILFFFLCFYALWQFKYFSDARKTVRLTCRLFLIAFVINVFRLTLPVPCISKSCIEIKIKLNFYFHTSFWYLKRFYEGLYEILNGKLHFLCSEIWTKIKIKPKTCLVLTSQLIFACSKSTIETVEKDVKSAQS